MRTQKSAIERELRLRQQLAAIFDEEAHRAQVSVLNEEKAALELQIHQLDQQESGLVVQGLLLAHTRRTNERVGDRVRGSCWREYGH